MTASRPEFAADYYAQRADAGLVITEATNISAQARGYALTPGIWTPEHVAAWSKVTRAVHKRDGKIFLQLWHTGRISHPDLHGGELPVAPSAIAPEGQAFTNEGLKDHVTPRALETAEIPPIVENYRHAAQCAKDAGFDGVEVHLRIIIFWNNSFRDSTNKRTDQYGGSGGEPAAVSVGGCEGGDFGMGRQARRYPDFPATTMPGNAPLDSEVMGTYGKYVDALSALGLLYIHDIEGVTQLTRETPEGWIFWRCASVFPARISRTTSIR